MVCEDTDHGVEPSIRNQFSKSVIVYEVQRLLAYYVLK